MEHRRIFDAIFSNFYMLQAFGQNRCRWNAWTLRMVISGFVLALIKHSQYSSSADFSNVRSDCNTPRMCVSNRDTPATLFHKRAIGLLRKATFLSLLITARGKLAAAFVAKQTPVSNHPSPLELGKKDPVEQNQLKVCVEDFMTIHNVVESYLKGPRVPR